MIFDNIAMVWCGVSCVVVCKHYSLYDAKLVVVVVVLNFYTYKMEETSQRYFNCMRSNFITLPEQLIRHSFHHNNNILKIFPVVCGGGGNIRIPPLLQSLYWSWIAEYGEALVISGVRSLVVIFIYIILLCIGLLLLLLRFNNLCLFLLYHREVYFTFTFYISWVYSYKN